MRAISRRMRDLEAEHNKNFSQSDARAEKAQQWVDRQIELLVNFIDRNGTTMSNGIQKEITFGQIFQAYEDKTDSIVGILMRSRKRGLVSYKGHMLFQGTHDNVRIVLLNGLPPPDETRAARMMNSFRTSVRKVFGYRPVSEFNGGAFAHQQQEIIPISEENADLSTYKRMVKAGLPQGAIEHKMELDGVDPKLLFGSSVGAGSSPIPEENPERQRYGAVPRNGTMRNPRNNGTMRSQRPKENYRTMESNKGTMRSQYSNNTANKYGTMESGVSDNNSSGNSGGKSTMKSNKTRKTNNNYGTIGSENSSNGSRANHYNDDGRGRDTRYGRANEYSRDNHRTEVSRKPPKPNYPNRTNNQQGYQPYVQPTQKRAVPQFNVARASRQVFTGIAELIRQRKAEKNGLQRINEVPQPKEAHHTPKHNRKSRKPTHYISPTTQHANERHAPREHHTPKGRHSPKDRHSPKGQHSRKDRHVPKPRPSPKQTSNFSKPPVPAQQRAAPKIDIPRQSRRKNEVSIRNRGGDRRGVKSIARLFGGGNNQFNNNIPSYRSRQPLEPPSAFTKPKREPYVPAPRSSPKRNANVNAARMESVRRPSRDVSVRKPKANNRGRKSMRKSALPRNGTLVDLKSKLTQQPGFGMSQPSYDAAPPRKTSHYRNDGGYGDDAPRKTSHYRNDGGYGDDAPRKTSRYGNDSGYGDDAPRKTSRYGNDSGYGSNSPPPTLHEETNDYGQYDDDYNGYDENYQEEEYYEGNEEYAQDGGWDDGYYGDDGKYYEYEGYDDQGYADGDREVPQEQKSLKKKKSAGLFGRSSLLQRASVLFTRKKSKKKLYSVPEENYDDAYGPGIGGPGNGRNGSFQDMPRKTSNGFRGQQEHRESPTGGYGGGAPTSGYGGGAPTGGYGGGAPTGGYGGGAPTSGYGGGAPTSGYGGGAPTSGYGGGAPQDNYGGGESSSGGGGGGGDESDPIYGKYYKMLKIGLPRGAVENAMQRDEVDPSGFRF